MSEHKIPAELTEQLGDPKSGFDGKAAARDSVLIAEDDPIFRRVLETRFKRWDYLVTAVENGLDAWDILQKESAPQLAILDWMMPGMDGIELCRKIRSRGQGPYQYVLLLTAKDDKQDVITGLEAGADDYLTKPFDVDELRARVRTGKRILDLQAALIKAQHDLQSAAAHDALTGLWNHGAILDLLGREVSRRKRTGDALGVVMADIDHFKKINDTHGHLIGDAVLQEVSRRLAANVRPYDAVGRYGGEEFLIVFPGCNEPNLLAGAERLRHCIADQLILTNVGQIPVTLSLGLAALKENPDCETLLRQADEALYAAKARGRNRVETAGASCATGS
ncbi:MAG: diguanylate cyclase [Candidatus Sulfotelmatobacter sp.]